MNVVCAPVLLVLLAAAALTLAQRYDLSEGSECTTPLGAPGVCVNLRQCPDLLGHLNLSRMRRPEGAQSADLLRRSLCSFRGQDPIVCCSGRISGNADRGSAPAPIPTAAPLAATTPPSRLVVWTPDSRRNITKNGNGNNGIPKTGHLAHRNADLLPVNCGEAFTTRIVGGKQADMGEHPWLAALEYQTRRGPTVLCGGTLINDRYVLTAAHCLRVPGNSRLIGVRLGEHNLMTETDCYVDKRGRQVCADPAITVGIESVIVHENYGGPERFNDIGLIRLQKKVPATNYIKPVCLPLSDILARSTFSGTQQVVAGWGRTENSPASEVKLKVALPVLENDKCAQLYSKNPQVKLDKSQLCAGGIKGKDSCAGDSGGPLVVAREDKWYLTGVVSIGPKDCGTQDMPGIYSRVTSFVPWIMDNLKP